MTTFTDPASWYASLPVLYAAAGALITDPAGRVLLVKPNYRDYWSLPGGICEHGESPHAACAREIREELGLDLEIGALLVIDWAPPDHDRPNPVVYFVFDGGTLHDTATIRLQAEELDDYGFTDPATVVSYLPPVIAARIPAALEARVTGAAVYLPHPAPASPPVPGDEQPLPWDDQPPLPWDDQLPVSWDDQPPRSRW